MLFDIQPRSKDAIYEQIVDQVIFNVASGGLVPGELIPSVRALAGKLTGPPNTVARAFQALERKGVLAPKRGVGMEVTEAGPELCRAKRREIVRERIRAALREARASALPPDEVKALVDQEFERVNGRK